MSFLDIAHERQLMDQWRDPPPPFRSGTREHAHWCVAFHDDWAKSRTGWALKFCTLSLCFSGLSALLLLSVGVGIVAHMTAGLPLGMAAMCVCDVIECREEQRAARMIADEWAALAESLQ